MTIRLTTRVYGLVLLITQVLLLLGAIRLILHGSTTSFRNALAIFALLGAAALLTLATLHMKTSLWPTPIPRASGQLITSGPFQWVRHPIYSALLLVGIAAALRWPNWVGFYNFSTLAFVLYLKSELEEKLLTQKFPDYPQYAKQVGRFIPHLKKTR